jgi:hypothetical protein
LKRDFGPIREFLQFGKFLLGKNHPISIRPKAFFTGESGTTEDAGAWCSSRGGAFPKNGEKNRPPDGGR